MNKLSPRPDPRDSQRKIEESGYLEQRYGRIGIPAVAAAGSLKKPDDPEREQRRRVLQVLARFED
jgi:hypothetical protein